MNEQERAEEHLKTIRRLMERATIYRAISAPTALVGGLLSLAASAIWMACLRSNPQVPCNPLLLWSAVLLITAATNTLFIVLGAKKRNEPVFSASMKAALIALAPALILGAVVTLCSAPSGEEFGGCLFLSSIWAACYGVGLLATSHFAPRSLALLGWAFLISAMAAMIYMRFLMKDYFGDWQELGSALFMALTFGLFHLIYAICAWPRNGAAPDL